MRLKILLALLVVAASLAFAPAGAGEAECQGPVNCSVKFTVWAGTHPVKAANPRNWGMECFSLGSLCVPRPNP